MIAAADWDWLYVIIGWSVTGVGALVVLAALFRDRSRGRRRCPKCWYDMQGTPGLRCPECGREAPHERKMLRTRRRWRWAALGVVIGIIGFAATTVPKYQRGGWVAMIPSSALVYLAPAVAPSPTAAQFPGRILTTWTAIGTPPPLTASEQLANEVWTRLRLGRLSAWQSQAYLKRFLTQNNLDIAQPLTLPDRWPLREPIPSLIQDRYFGGLAFRARVIDGTWKGPKVGLFDAPPAPCKELKVELGLRGDKDIVYRVSRTVPIVVDGSAESFLQRLDTAESTALVRNALNPHLSRSEGVPVVILYDRTFDAAWTQIPFGVAYAVEVSIDGKTIGTGTGMVQWSREVWKGWDELEVKWTDRAALDREGARPMITVRGRHEPVTLEYLTWPFDKPAAACWTGEFTMPVEFKKHPGETAK